MAFRVKAAILSGIFGLILGTAPALAQPAVGVAAAVRGNVEAAGAAAGTRILESGASIFLGDRITTDSRGHIQILLKDETVFTLGPDSALEMDEFIYDPNTEAGKVGAEVVKGVFRFVSGKVARKDPNNVEIKLPAGNIGIRGTIVGGKVEGMKSLVVLLGPGAKNNTGNKPGAIEVSNQIKEKVSKVKVDRTGFGTTIEGPDAGPSRPKLVPLDQMTALTNALQPSAEEGKEEDAAPAEGEGSASEQAGQSIFETLEDLGNTEEAGELTQDADDATQSAAQNATQIGRVADGVASLDDLRRIESGIFHYDTFGNGAILGSFIQTTVNGVGGFNIRGIADIVLNIDFGSRTVYSELPGNNEKVITNSAFSPCSGVCDPGGDINYSFQIEPQSFNAGAGSAVFVDSDSRLTVTVTLNNRNGNVAIDATVASNYSFNDGGGIDAGSGSVVAPRLEGPCPSNCPV